MDWKSALITIAFVLLIKSEVSTAGRKKIRIHIPQKVKHIHHHKKIYITKHVTQPTPFVPPYADSEQYASGYPSPTESITAITPTLAILPLGDGRRSTPGPSTAPNLQPLYRARGHYGPTTTPPSKFVTEYKTVPTTKRVKVIKISDGKKKVIKMKKPKRIIIKDSEPIQEDKDNSQVSSFHKEFYSDVGPSHTTVRGVKKPKRVEKYVDGDTEHIHTYSEEHIHEVVYDNQGVKKPNDMKSPLIPIDVAIQQSVNAPVASFIPSPVLPSVIPSTVAIQSASPAQIHPMNHLIGGTMGSMGTPPHLEYMHYDPQDVTHDHIFHDHGEIIHALIPEKKFPGPPKASYNKQGIKINSNFNAEDLSGYDGKGSWISQDNIKNENMQGLSYYENLYNPKKKEKQNEKHKNSIKSSSNVNYNRYKYTDEIPINSDAHYEDFSSEYGKHKHYGNQKLKTYKPSSTFSTLEGHIKPKHLNSLRQQHHNKAAQNKPYGTVPSYSNSYTVGSHITINNNFKEPKNSANYKHYTNIYSSSKPMLDNAFTSSPTDNKKDRETSILNWRTGRKNKNKKSISTQNINFSGQEHKTIINHENAESRNIESHIVDSSPQSSDINFAYPTAESFFSIASPDTLKSTVAIPDASNHNFRIVAPPVLVETEHVTEKNKEERGSTPKSIEKTMINTSAENVQKQQKRAKKKNTDKKQKVKRPEDNRQQPIHPETSTKRSDQTLTNRGKFKYGDKLMERYDHEYDDVIFV